MNLENTIKLMNSEDYKERFQGEYFQLKTRTQGLEKMLVKYKAGTLSFKPTSSYEVLYTQLVYMKNYLDVLETRAVFENIDLNNDEE